MILLITFIPHQSGFDLKTQKVLQLNPYPTSLDIVYEFFSLLIMFVITNHKKIQKVFVFKEVKKDFFGFNIIFLLTAVLNIFSALRAVLRTFSVSRTVFDLKGILRLKSSWGQDIFPWSQEYHFAHTDNSRKYFIIISNTKKFGWPLLNIFGAVKWNRKQFLTKQKTKIGHEHFSDSYSR